MRGGDQAVKASTTVAAKRHAAPVPPEPPAGSEATWHIELRRQDKAWRAVIESGGAVRSEASLHELIRWLVGMAAGHDRPSGGLR